MQLIYHSDFLAHDTGGHPERKERLHAFRDLPDAALPDVEDWLLLVHEPAYIDQVRKSVASGHWLDPETPISSGSWKAAIAAVAATRLAMETGGFALARPPGHHAYPGHCSGFCIFNNVAIAAQYLVRQGKRVLIFDFDGHLGDGTSRIFSTTDQVMYWSIHQYPAFPGHGFIDEIGEGKGKGYTLNSPLPPGSGDDIFWSAFDHLLPLARQFKPDVVALSAGFDGYQYDPLLELRYSLDMFYQLGIRLTAEFPNTFATLEGGYNLQTLPKCIFNFLAGMNGLEAPYQEEPTVSGRSVWERFEANLYAGLHYLEPYWTIR
ncbi:MAG: histone deacetylase family protein [Saprospiraceae bacterium]